MQYPDQCGHTQRISEIRTGHRGRWQSRSGRRRRAAGKLTNREAPPAVADGPAPILLSCQDMEPRYQMNPVTLLTLTCGHDLERCSLPRASLDRRITSGSKYCLPVPLGGQPLFSRCEGGGGSVLSASRFLPDRLPVPARVIQRARPQFWWAGRTRPANGRHERQPIRAAIDENAPSRDPRVATKATAVIDPLCC